MAADALTELFLIGGNHLWQVNAPGGSFTDLGGGWSGPTVMTSIYNTLYIVQNSRLWKVTTSGSFTQLGQPVWAGATSIAGKLDTSDAVYIIQDSRLFRVNVSDGTYAQLGGASWGGPTLMVCTATFS